MLCGFCSKFHKTFQQCSNSGNRLTFDKVTESLKVGIFLRHSACSNYWENCSIAKSHLMPSNFSTQAKTSAFVDL